MKNIARKIQHLQPARAEKHLKKFYNTNPRSSTGSAFSVQQSGKRKTGTNP